MTDTNMLQLLRDDFKGVELSVNELSVKVAGVESTLRNVDSTLKEHRDDIKETRKDQLECSAKAGWITLNREMKEVRKKQSAYRIHVESEMKEMREDVTGQFDIPVVPSTDNKQTNGTMLAGFFKTFGPWIAAFLIGLGVYLGSGGDEEKTIHILKNLQEISLKVAEIEKNNTPNSIPVVPEYVSEEL